MIVLYVFGLNGNCSVSVISLTRVSSVYTNIKDVSPVIVRWKNQYTSVWKPETVIGVQKLKRHCLVSVHFHGNQTDLIKNKDSWGLVPVYHFPGWCMDPWNPLHKGLWVHNPDLLGNGFLLSFWYQLFHQLRILHMSWQQSCGKFWPDLVTKPKLPSIYFYKIWMMSL